MPRTGALLSLSREHHTSLVMARAARKAADANDNFVCLEVLMRIEAHWHAVLVAHFAQEEQLIQLAADALDSESIMRILSEHAELHRLACGPCLLEPVVRLRRFGDLLAAHVRYEERVIFPQLQSHSGMTSEALLNPNHLER